MKGKTNIVQLETWNELITALRNRYTLPFSETCEILKASRSWVNKYIRPHVPAVYISSGIVNGHQRGASWTRLASKQLGKEITDQIWLDREEFEKFIRESIVSCTAQTKYVPYALLIPPVKRDQFRTEYCRITDELNDAMMNMQHSEVSKLQEALVKLINTSITGDVEQDMLKSRLDPSRRGGVDAWPVAVPVTPLSEWKAVHDLRGYSGVDEIIYRRLFTEGAIRIEIQVPALTGELSKKVYYISDPDPITDELPDGIVVPIRLWHFYKGI